MLPNASKQGWPQESLPPERQTLQNERGLTRSASNAKCQKARHQQQKQELRQKIKADGFRVEGVCQSLALRLAGCSSVPVGMVI